MGGFNNHAQTNDKRYRNGFPAVGPQNSSVAACL